MSTGAYFDDDVRGLACKAVARQQARDTLTLFDAALDDPPFVAPDELALVGLGPALPLLRKRRVEVSISKMRGGKRRPCCFNLASCTDPELSKSGKLVTG